MQISGEKSFIAGSNELIVFKDIRKSITKAEAVHLSITEKPLPEEDRPCNLNVRTRYVAIYTHNLIIVYNILSLMEMLLW